MAEKTSLYAIIAINQSSIQIAVIVAFYLCILGIRQNPWGPVEFVLNVPPVYMTHMYQTNHQNH